MVFSGAHADVGGGYPENGLSQVVLQWMFDELNGLGAPPDLDPKETAAPYKLDNVPRDICTDPGRKLCANCRFS